MITHQVRHWPYRPIPRRSSTGLQTKVIRTAYSFCNQEQPLVSSSPKRVALSRAEPPRTNRPADRDARVGDGRTGHGDKRRL